MITLILLLLAVPLAQLVLMISIYAKSRGKIFRSASGTFAAVSVGLAILFLFRFYPMADDSQIGLIFLSGIIEIAPLIILVCYKLTQRNSNTDELPSLLHFIWGICICIGLVLWIVLFLWEMLCSFSGS